MWRIWWCCWRVVFSRYEKVLGGMLIFYVWLDFVVGGGLRETAIAATKYSRRIVGVGYLPFTLTYK